jgi:uncharacterized membrane protein
MLFVLVSLIFIAVSVLVWRACGVRNPYSKGVLLALLITVVAAVCLAENYATSLIPEANDGIGLSNPMAYWIIGEDGWSRESFKAWYVKSVYLTLLLIVAYPVVLTLESPGHRRRNR